MELRHRSLLDALPRDIVERVVSFLPSTDLANLRLANKACKQLTNRYVTKLRPAALTPLLNGTLAHRHPALTCLDLSALDVLSDPQLSSVARKLAEMPNLGELGLRCGAGVTFKGFESLAKAVPQLNRLSLRSAGSVRQGCSYDASVLDLDVVGIDLFRDLTHLDLSWNTVTPQCLQSIALLPKVKNLNLKNCLGVDDGVIEILTSMASLRVLNLSYTNVTDEGLMMMNELELEALNVSKCEGVTDDGMFWLQHIRTLQKVDISSCPGITSAGIEQLTHLPNLTNLYLQDLKSLGSAAFKKMDRLTTISLRDCGWVTDRTLKDLASCTTLQCVNLRNCDQITDAGLDALQQLPLLRSVNLRGCTNITDAGISVLSTLPAIEDIDLSFLNQITDAALGSLSQASTLRRVILNWCNLITSVGLHHLRSACTNLKELSIKGCHNMQFTDLVSMARSCVQRLDYEHSLCSILTGEHKHDLPLLRHIDSAGCFFEIC